MEACHSAQTVPDRMENRDHYAQQDPTIGIIWAMYLRLSNLSVFLAGETEHSAHPDHNNHNTSKVLRVLSAPRYLTIPRVEPRALSPADGPRTGHELRYTMVDMRMVVYPGCNREAYREGGIPTRVY